MYECLYVSVCVCAVGQNQNNRQNDIPEYSPGKGFRIKVNSRWTPLINFKSSLTNLHTLTLPTSADFCRPEKSEFHYSNWLDIISIASFKKNSSFIFPRKALQMILAVHNNIKINNFIICSALWNLCYQKMDVERYISFDGLLPSVLIHKRQMERARSRINSMVCL